MYALFWTALAIAVTSLLVALGVCYVVWLLRQKVVEPIELRRQVMQFDQLLTEHDEKLRAYYARQRKRDKTLTTALAEGTLPGIDEQTNDVVAPPPGDPKAAIRQRARQQGVL